MLKTQITGAKYLSPQTNQMTNLNIAVPADSKDTEFGTSDILLAKDVVAYLNALDSDISNELDAQTDKINKINESIKQLIDHNLIKIVTELPTTDIDKNCIYLVPNKDGEGNNVFIEYIYVESKNIFEEVGRIQAKVDLSGYYTKEETDNLILIAKNSAINIHNEDNSKSIKLDINDTEAEGEYGGSTVNVSLTDDDLARIANINAVDGFRHSDSDGRFSNLYCNGLDIIDVTHNAQIDANSIIMYDDYDDGSITISTNARESLQNSPIAISLTDDNYKAIINAKDGFKHSDNIGRFSNLHNRGLDIDEEDYHTGIKSNSIFIANNGMGGFVEINTNKELTLEEQNNGYSIVDMSLTDGYYNANINAKNGFTHKADDGFISNLNGYGFSSQSGSLNTCISTDGLAFYDNDKELILMNSDAVEHSLTFGNDKKFKISRPADNTEGATITGVKSLTAFANPSATKVWATDGSTVDLTTKANASDVLLKKSADGGFYISDNIYKIGSNSFAANNTCKANGTYAFAECGSTTASGANSHAEGSHTTASGLSSHSEGLFTEAGGRFSHAEGRETVASGYASHALGSYNIEDINAIHSVGIGNGTTRKNAEYIYAKSNTNGVAIVDDPKNGYKYLIGVGGYDGISTDNTTYKSVQEVIADLTSRIEQLETKVRALEAANTPA